MTALVWDKAGEREYETGVDRGVLYMPNGAGVFDTGYAWNGLTTITEKPTGDEPNAIYADNQKYLTLLSAPDFGGTIEAFTYPDKFAQCDGTAVLTPGLRISGQARSMFGLSYRTIKGNDLLGNAYAYRIHMIYNALAAPSEKAFATVNDSPEALAFSWDFSTTPVATTGYKPVALATVDSDEISAATLTALEQILYGTAGAAPRLPLPDELVTILAGGATTISPTIPTYTSATHTITIPTQTGVVYTIDGVVKTGSVVLTSGQRVIVKATALPTYNFSANTDTTWQFDY